MRERGDGAGPVSDAVVWVPCTLNPWREAGPPNHLDDRVDYALNPKPQQQSVRERGDGAGPGARAPRPTDRGRESSLLTTYWSESTLSLK